MWLPLLVFPCEWFIYSFIHPKIITKKLSTQQIFWRKLNAITRRCFPVFYTASNVYLNLIREQPAACLSRVSAGAEVSRKMWIESVRVWIDRPVIAGTAMRLNSLYLSALPQGTGCKFTPLWLGFDLTFKARCAASSANIFRCIYHDCCVDTNKTGGLWTRHALLIEIMLYFLYRGVWGDKTRVLAAFAPFLRDTRGLRFLLFTSVSLFWHAAWR